MKVGQRVRAFDADLWRESGYDCARHRKNECFFLPATVVRVYRDGGDQFADVIYDHYPPGHVSRAHFVSTLRKVARGEG